MDKKVNVNKNYVIPLLNIFYNKEGLYTRF